MKCYAVTHPGLVRDGNEDYYFIPENGECFAIVCDGMGGCNAGEVASRTAVDSMKAQLAGARPSPEMLKSAILNVNRDVYDMASAQQEYAGMGTTLTALWWTDDKVLIGHVGDSRLYRYDGKKLSQLTHDHTYVQELVDRGELSSAEARAHPFRNLITRAIGTETNVDVDTAGFERTAGAIYLICSDGLTTMLEDSEISDILRQGEPPEQLEALLAGALARGGKDNITAVLAVDGEVGQ